MEVKPHVLDQVVFHVCDQVTESCAYFQLRSFLVYQVDENLFTIALFHLFHMFPGKLKWLIIVWMNLDRGCPLHCWLLAPQCRNGASCLNVTCNSNRVPCLIEWDHMFSLYEVCHISFSVNASDNEPTTWSSAVLLWYKGEVKLLESVNLYCPDKAIPIDARDLEWSILEVIKRLKEMIVENEVSLVSHCVGI